LGQKGLVVAAAAAALTNAWSLIIIQEIRIRGLQAQGDGEDF
jgi:hypothetical protein